MCTREETEIIEKCLTDFKNGKDDARKYPIEGLSDKAYKMLCKELDIGEKYFRRMGLWNKK